MWILTFSSWFDIKLLLYFYDERDYKYIHIYIHTRNAQVYIIFLSILATLDLFLNLPDIPFSSYTSSQVSTATILTLITAVRVKGADKSIVEVGNEYIQSRNPELSAAIT